MMERSLSRRIALGASLLGLSVPGCGTSAPGNDHVGAVKSAIVGGSDSTSDENFIVLLTHLEHGAQIYCSGTLVAPNLVLTAKHCVYEFDQAPNNYICDASGEPQPGSTGGFVTAQIAPGEISIFTGIDAKAKFSKGEAAAAVGKTIIDDVVPTLCSHDLAFLVLDKPITDMPIGRLRLGKRPEEGGSFMAVAGWGVRENKQTTLVRIRRGGLTIQRVGPPAPEPNASGSLSPRAFETGPAACTQDSGSPGFVDGSSTVLGVVARLRNFDPTNPISPCIPDNVINVYMVVADFPKLVRDGFAAAGAQPWLEGYPAPGFIAGGETCQSDLECEGNLCAGLTSERPGNCAVECTQAGFKCPDGTTCEIKTRTCEAPDVDAGPRPQITPDASTGKKGSSSSSSGCSYAAQGPRGSWYTLLLACAALARGIQVRRRLRRSS
jgi:hypothetical protein